MAKKKLVPLVPILRRLNACVDGIDAVREMNAPTFREAWRRCPHAGHLAWLAHEALGLGRRWYCARRSKLFTDFVWVSPTCSHYASADKARAAIEAIVSPAEVERALYDYAVREGLA